MIYQQMFGSYLVSFICIPLVLLKKKNLWAKMGCEQEKFQNSVLGKDEINSVFPMLSGHSAFCIQLKLDTLTQEKKSLKIFFIIVKADFLVLNIVFDLCTSKRSLGSLTPVSMTMIMTLFGNAVWGGLYWVGPGSGTIRKCSLVAVGV